MLKSENMMNTPNIQRTAAGEIDYYGLYLLRHLLEHRFAEAADAAFVRGRAARAGAAFEQARREGLTAAAAQERAMEVLMQGLHTSRYDLLREVVESEFFNEVPPAHREAFIERLLPSLDALFAPYDLADDDFALSPACDRLYTEITGAVAIHIEAHGL